MWVQRTWETAKAVWVFYSSAMLVLTTMFINVSNNLPKTSYVKMIDIWLIFNLLLPFIEVLVHTLMDTLRWSQHEDLWYKMWRNDDDREINHHGRPVEVGEEQSSRPGSCIPDKVDPNSKPKDEEQAKFNIWRELIYSSNYSSQTGVYWQATPFSEKDLVAVNEQVQMKALKSFYER